jgi:hypothetical protein
MPFWKWLLKVTPQHGMAVAWAWAWAWAWHVWISIGRPETACGRPACVRLLLPATTLSSTKVVIRSMPIRYTVALAVRIFPATTRTFTKDTALSDSGRGAAWHVWIGTAWARNGMCELALRLLAFCIVIISYTEPFRSPCITLYVLHDLAL